MPTRSSKLKWVTLCVGVLLMAGPVAPARSGWLSDCMGKKKTDDCPAEEAVNDCPEDVQDCPKERRTRCRRCHGRGCPCCCGPCYCRGCLGGCLFGSGPRYLPTNALYCDFRDRQLFAAEGYGVPVTVPLAPACRTFNDGWGIPSSRLTAAGSYASWYPDQPYSQSGGKLPVRYPTIYHPTDTTQLGYYYNYVPSWQPRRW